MVARKSRVQVDSGIRQPGMDTYRAVDMPHVGPQRKQSEASNYERLARDLGQFNSNLQSFGRAVDAAQERAAKRAEKLEKEKKAAEARQKREAARKARGSGGGRRRRSTWRGRKKGSGVSRSEKRRLEYDEKVSIEDEWGPVTDDKGDAGRSKVDGEVVYDPGTGSEVINEPSATKKTYKSLSAVKAGIGKEYYQEGMAALEQEKREGFKRYKEDEHGNREYFDPEAKLPDLGIVKAPTAEEERDPTKQKDTMLSKSGYVEKTEVISDQEIKLQHYKRQKLIEARGFDPIVTTHLKGVEHKIMEKRLKWQKKAEYEDRRSTAGQFVRDTVADNIKTLQGEGFDPDTVSRMAQGQAMQDMHLLFPDATREEITHYMFQGLTDTINNPNATAEEARMVLNFIQGSPASENGVASWIQHPKYQKHAKRMAAKASQVFVNAKAEQRKSLLAKQYLNAVDAGEPRPFIGDIKEPPVNGKTKTIAASETQALVGSMLDASILEPGGVPVPEKDLPKKIPEIFTTYEQTPDIQSPFLAKTFANFDITQTHAQNPAQAPAYQVAMTAYAQGGDAVTVLQRHLSPSQRAYFDQVWALRRNGIVDQDEVTEKMQLWVSKKRRGQSGPTLGTKLENGVRPWHPDDLSKTQRDQILDTVRMAVYDKNLSTEEVIVRLDEAAENYREYNPTLNGHTVEINPALPFKKDEFITHAEAEIEDMKAKNPKHKDSKVSLKRYGNLYLYIDAENGKPLNDADGDPMGFSVTSIMANAGRRNQIAKKEKEVKDKTRVKTNYEYKKKGGDAGFLARLLGFSALDETPERAEIERMEGETAEIESIVKEPKQYPEVPTGP